MCRTSARIEFVKIDDQYGANDVALIVGDHNTYGKFTLLLEITNSNLNVGRLIQGFDSFPLGRDDMAFVQDVKTALAANPEHGLKVIDRLEKLKPYEERVAACFSIPQVLDMMATEVRQRPKSNNIDITGPAMKRIAELDLENLKRVVDDPKDLG